MERMEKGAGRYGLGVQLTQRQADFCAADADEVLFGGAAGGGKTYGQLMDVFCYAARWAGSKQLMLRRTYAELEKSVIRVALAVYPAGSYKYNAARHCMVFGNGSLVDFGHVNSEKDVYRYQSAEYDQIRFDELTHFSEESYLFLLSRLRGTARLPRQVKSTSNPGGVGHHWVKQRFVDAGVAGAPFAVGGGKRLYLPARLSDNPYLEGADPGYRKRLEQMGERERRMYLEGDWEVLEGRFFPEFGRASHVEEAFAIPAHWTVVRALDYGLDMLACYWVALDEAGGQ